MFFIGVFGIDNKEKEIKILNNFCCKNCNESSEAKLIKTYSFFHFFFLPLFKWNEKYYVICNGCNSIFNIDKEKGKAIERGEKSEISYWDLKEVNNSSMTLTMTVLPYSLVSLFCRATRSSPPLPMTMPGLAQ